MKRGIETLTQEQIDMIYSMSMSQCAINDIATTACLDAYELVAKDERIYHHLVKKLANRLRDAARDHDHHAVLELDELGRMRYADYFDAWQDEVGDSITKVRMCIKNDVDKRKEPSGNALSAVLIAQAISAYARRSGLQSAYDVHKSCPGVRLKPTWHVGARLSNLANQLADAITKGCEYAPSEDTRKAALAVSQKLNNPAIYERIMRENCEKYRRINA